ncbi:MAG TPA: selenium-binding protein SBP56-related protein [Kofleriaceae bacterium]|nr:selenium-binding protein SBP56-related protein [Kofleriaceae bacterium]
MVQDAWLKASWGIAALGLVTAAPACVLTGDEDTTAQQEATQPPREKFMYIVSINRGGSQDPDSVVLVGTDPDEPSSYGKIFNRVDMPNVGDEVHHFSYTYDETKLLVPGVFSGRMHVLDLAKPKAPKVVAVGDTTTGGYIIPHSVLPQPDGSALVTMIGAATSTTGPGGIIRIDTNTGNFSSYYGPGPNRTETDLGPKYMYDYDKDDDQGRGISTTFGWPALVGGGISPGGLGDEIAVWDLSTEKVIQTFNLGTNSGALEVRFIDGTNTGYINTPGTGAVWFFEDDDGDGFFAFHNVLNTGLAIPVDMLLSADNKYMYITNWFGDNVQQYDITNRYSPRLVGSAWVPHANMIRLSNDGKRLYVTNELLSTWDDDPNFGPPRNTNYGLWAFNVNTDTGGLTSFTADGSAWVKMDSVQKKTSVGPIGPHMMLFDAKASPTGAH